MRSGYDIKLVGDLLHADDRVSLPNTRLLLYHATIDNVERKSNGCANTERISKLAWELWKTGSRQFSADESITPSTIAPWRDANVLVSRGPQYAFRHDLIRAYLAAHWAKHFSASVSVTCERLNNTDIWDMSPDDQRTVFQFLAELLTSEDELLHVGQFAMSEPNVRSELLAAIQLSARKRGCPLMLRLCDS